MNMYKDVNIDLDMNMNKIMDIDVECGHAHGLVHGTDMETDTGIDKVKAKNSLCRIAPSLG
jgi:hypothetical protein